MQKVSTALGEAVVLIIFFLFFYWGGGLPFLGLAYNFFLKSNAFQTIFFITFCNENNIFTTIFKKMLQAFYRSYLKKKNTSCACIRMKSHLNETTSP